MAVISNTAVWIRYQDNDVTIDFQSNSARVT
jgi:hypothetical protein